MKRPVAYAMGGAIALALLAATAGAALGESTVTAHGSSSAVGAPTQESASASTPTPTPALVRRSPYPTEEPARPGRHPDLRLKRAEIAMNEISNNHLRVGAMYPDPNGTGIVVYIEPPVAEVVDQILTVTDLTRDEVTVIPERGPVATWL